MQRSIVAVLVFILIVPAYVYAGQVGAKAPSFSLPDLHGKTISLEDFKGKVVFLDFWAPWCRPCRDELPVLDTLSGKYGKDGLVVIAVSVDTVVQNVTRFIQKVPLRIDILVDGKNEVADAYRVSILPTGFIIGRDGVIRYLHKGFDKGLVPLYEKEITELLNQH